jgi:hypothetical protein
LFIIDLPERKTTLLYFIEALINWMMRQTLDANVATMILQSVSLIIRSIVSQTAFSEIARPILSHHKLSQMYNFTHSVPILAIFARSAGLSIAGV